MSKPFESMKQFLEYIASGKKFRHGTWETHVFAHLVDNRIMFDDDMSHKVSLLEYMNYMPYEEPKRKLWRWRLEDEDSVWESTMYLDEEGRYKSGVCYSDSWDSLKKTKIEGSEIQVDE